MPPGRGLPTEVAILSKPGGTSKLPTTSRGLARDRTSDCESVAVVGVKLGHQRPSAPSGWLRPSTVRQDRPVREPGLPLISRRGRICAGDLLLGLDWLRAAPSRQRLVEATRRNDSALSTAAPTGAPMSTIQRAPDDR